MSTTKAARWLDLIAFLMDRTEPVTREQLFERIPEYRKDWKPDDAKAHETLRRKFERDKDELREWGVAIETVELPWATHDEPQTGYRLAKRDAYLPYLQRREDSGGPSERPYGGLRQVALGDDDLEMLDRVTQRLAQRDELPLRRAALSLRRKLEFDLPLSVTAIERVLGAPMSSEAERTLAALQDAVTDRVAISCVYYTIARDEEQERVIEPYGLFFVWGKWYCVARARDRDAQRVFRVDRMRTVKRVKGESSFDVPGSFAIREYLDRAPWELSSRKGDRVVVRFDFPASRWVLARDVGDVVDGLLDDGGARLAFAVADRSAFLRWVLTFRDAARIESPHGVRDELERLRARVLALYEETG